MGRGEGSHARARTDPGAGARVQPGSRHRPGKGGRGGDLEIAVRVRRERKTRSAAVFDRNRGFKPSHCGTAVIPKPSPEMNARGLRPSPDTSRLTLTRFS